MQTSILFLLVLISNLKGGIQLSSTIMNEKTPPKRKTGLKGVEAAPDVKTPTQL